MTYLSETTADGRLVVPSQQNVVAPFDVQGRTTTPPSVHRTPAGAST